MELRESMSTAEGAGHRAETIIPGRNRKNNPFSVSGSVFACDSVQRACVRSSKFFLQHSCCPEQLFTFLLRSFVYKKSGIFY